MQTINLLSRPLGIGDIISYGFRIYWLNFKKFIYYSLIPTLCYFFIAVFPSFYLQQLMGRMSCEFCVISVFLMITSLFALWLNTIFNIGMAKAYYNFILDKDYSYKTIFKWMRSSYKYINKVAIWITTLIVIASFVLGSFLTVCMMIFLTFVIANDHVIYIIMGIIMIVIAIALGILVCYIFFYVHSCSIIAGIEGLSLKDLQKKSYSFLARSPSKPPLLAFTLIFCWVVGMFYLKLPVMCYWLLVSFMDLPVTTYFLMKICANTLDTVVPIILWPSIMACMVVFIYNQKCAVEGVDMLETLKNEEQFALKEKSDVD